MGSRFAARFDPDAPRGLRLTLVVAAVFLVAVPFGVLVLEVATRGRVVKIDAAVAWHQNLDNHIDRDRVAYAQVLTQFGSTAVLVAVVAATVSWLALLGRRRQALYVLITSAFGAIMNVTLKAAIGRSRPHFDDAVAHALGKSFPSGHAMNAAVVYGAVIVVLWQPLRGWRRRVTLLGLLSGLVVGIAASRVVLTVHYVSDVVAGVVLGVALVLGSAAAFQVWQVEEARSPAGGSDPDAQPRVGSVPSTADV